MERLWRKAMLFGGLLSALGGLFGASSGCTRGGGDVAKSPPDAAAKEPEGETLPLDFPIEPEQTRAIAGRPDLGKTWAIVTFAAPVHFNRVGETVEAFGYEALTLADFGEAHTGKYAMNATLRRGYTGGPPGSATSLYLQVEDVRVVGKLTPPKAAPGTKAILPGQVVVRMIPPGELARVDDRYVIDLPANTLVTVWFDPRPRDYSFRLSAAKDGTAFPIRKGRDQDFDTASAGTYELRVLPAGTATKEPDSYFFNVTWGISSSKGDLREHQIKWHTPGPGVPPEHTP
jgi:hypothetical protein